MRWITPTSYGARAACAPLRHPSTSFGSRVTGPRHAAHENTNAWRMTLAHAHTSSHPTHLCIVSLAFGPALSAGAAATVLPMWTDVLRGTTSTEFDLYIDRIDAATGSSWIHSLHQLTWTPHLAWVLVEKAGGNGAFLVQFPAHTAQQSRNTFIKS